MATLLAMIGAYDNSAPTSSIGAVLHQDQDPVQYIRYVLEREPLPSFAPRTHPVALADINQLAFEQELRCLWDRTEFQSMWHQVLAPHYKSYLDNFRSWVAEERPQDVLEQWTGWSCPVDIEVYPTFFLPPPPEGRLGLLLEPIHGRTPLRILFGLPRYGRMTQFGMHPTWLKRGIWHYCVQHFLLRNELGELSSSHDGLVKELVKFYKIDHSTATRLLGNYLARVLIAVILEAPQDRVRALHHLRGNGYLLAPWLARALIVAHEREGNLTPVIASALEAFNAEVQALTKGRYFAGSLEACFLESWAFGGLMVTPTGLDATPALRYRLRALAMVSGIEIVSFDDYDPVHHVVRSEWLVGVPGQNPLVDAALRQHNITVTTELIHAFNHLVRGRDLVLAFVRPHPIDPTKWSLICTATSTAALATIGRRPWDREADYCVSSSDEILVSGVYGAERWGVRVDLEPGYVWPSS